MLYFMGYTDSPGNWTGNFTRAVRRELEIRKIPYVELPPFDWYTQNADTNCYLNIESKPDDVWFISWAQSPIIELIKHKKGRKFGLVVGLTAMPFEPAVLWEAEENINEEERLHAYDNIFANSHWCKECICRYYPKLANRVIVTGFPVDYHIYEPYRHIPKEKNLVVFNQRFALEKLHILELEVAHHLIGRGYRVMHLSGISENELATHSTTVRAFLIRTKQIGMEFLYNPTKEAYHRNLARASFVITTSIADMLPSSLIEAIYLGAIPVAPNNLCFPEFVHKDNLYTPYDIKEILEIVSRKPTREHSIKKYSKEIVIKKFLKEMGLLK